MRGGIGLACKYLFIIMLLSCAVVIPYDLIFLVFLVFSYVSYFVLYILH